MAYNGDHSNYDYYDLPQLSNISNNIFDMYSNSNVPLHQYWIECNESFNLTLWTISSQCGFSCIGVYRVEGNIKTKGVHCHNHNDIIKNWQIGDTLLDRPLLQLGSNF